MQTSTAILSAVTVQRVVQPVANTPWMPRVLRTFARHWDLIGVVTLMASSTAYGLHALTHLGF